VQVTRATIRQAEQVLAEMETQAVEHGQRLIVTLRTFMPRAQQVLDQTIRRVFSGERVPADEKLVSLFEPHTDIIRRGKPNKETEFGHKVWLGEVEGGFITQYQVLDGNPADETQWQPMLERHVQQFGQPPWQASADRGVYSSDNEADATKLGVGCETSHLAQAWAKVGNPTTTRETTMVPTWPPLPCRRRGPDQRHQTQAWP
jgi:IS5 family transposase